MYKKPNTFSYPERDQFNRALPSYWSTTDSNSTPIPCKYFLSFLFPNQNPVCISLLRERCHFSALLILLDLNIQILLIKEH